MAKKKRNSLIVKEDIGFSFYVHNGKIFVLVKVVEGMENDYYGSYTVTKKLGSSIHKIKKKASKKSNKKRK